MGAGRARPGLGAGLGLGALPRCGREVLSYMAEWRFEHGGWLQVYQLPERAGAGSFTLSVTNLDEQIAKLDAMQMNTQQRTSSPTVRTVMITDPDGNHIAFAEALDASAEH